MKRQKFSIPRQPNSLRKSNAMGSASSTSDSVDRTATSQSSVRYATIAIANSSNLKEKLYCHILIHSEDPTQLFLIVFDFASPPCPRFLVSEQESQIDYVSFILRVLDSQECIHMLYERLHKLYIDDYYADISRELITQCILAKSVRKDRHHVEEYLYSQPIEIVISNATFASLPFHSPLEIDPTVIHTTKRFPLTKRKPSSCVSDKEFEDCFAEIELAMDPAEYDELTLAVAFDVCIPTQHTRLENLRSTNSEFHATLLEWAEYLKMKYVEKGYTFTQVRQIHAGNYDQAGITPDADKIANLTQLANNREYA